MFFYIKRWVFLAFMLYILVMINLYNSSICIYKSGMNCSVSVCIYRIGIN